MGIEESNICMLLPSYGVIESFSAISLDWINLTELSYDVISNGFNCVVIAHV